MTQLKESHHFIHNVFASFFKDSMDFFTCIYPRFIYNVIGVYEKGVEYINKECQYGRETDKPMLPSLILNPSGDFSTADANAGGHQLWRFPNLSSSMIKRLFDPIYKDQHVQVHAGFLRIKGEMELIMLCNSFYEYCDLRMLFINTFGGMDRIIYPTFFSSFIILPQSFLDYRYKNEYTGDDYKINWETANASLKLVKTIATEELVLPLNIGPQFSLTSLSDGSTRYGGPDDIAEWKLNAIINYEVEIPNYLIIESDYLVEGIDIEIGYGSAFSVYNDYQPPVDRILYNFSWDWGLNYDTNTPDKLGYMNPNDTTSITTYVGDFIYKNRYFHTVTEEEALLSDTTNNLEISLPEQILDPKILIVNSKEGQLKFGDHYYLKDDGWTLVIRTGDTSDYVWNTCPPVTETTHWVYLQKGWILELFIYEKLATF